MKRYSGRQLAAAYVRLRARYAAGPLVRALAGELVRLRASGDVDRVVSEIGRELLRQRRVLLAEVTSARPLSHELQSELKTLLTQATGAQTVHLSCDVDPTVIGGVSVRTPAALLEATVRGRLRTLATL